MAYRVGENISDVILGVDLLVLKVPSADAHVRIAPSSQPLLLGKRYRCDVCEGEFLVSKAGAATASCHGTELSIKAAWPCPPRTDPRGCEDLRSRRDSEQQCAGVYR
jgi:hypothetical protein